MRERLTATEESQARLAPEDRSEYQVQALKRQLEQNRVGSRICEHKNLPCRTG
jgi:hypothetical protein